ncbi:hypothetical protein [Leptothoe spongobia]|uniref:Uncharacterized protein n=1 Tax=Leptothoe spongobia TAU-MAC 1115 TaxID=1967444 RepID=A0A947GLS6_9CYAN|nr:hypothetical protein [Leptothoe spongobia]MBT9317533.1 hypothetical protein [Leptothoe spongobia TAU-MAC 1115]
MAGLFGLFGGNQDQGPQSKEAFFLSEDDAKTLGDIDYMRKEVVVRRTFAKKKGQEELESVRSISSSNSVEVGEAAKPTTSGFGAATFAAFRTPAPAAPAPAAPAPTPAAAPVAETPVAETPVAETPAAETPAQEPVVRRTPDTGMDMFRNMAKNIRR